VSGFILLGEVRRGERERGMGNGKWKGKGEVREK
jgi:hypothetical protein